MRAKVNSQRTIYYGVHLFRFTGYNELRLTVSLRQEKVRNYGLTLQPFVLLLGPDPVSIESEYVVLDQERFYKMESPLRAQDIFFKGFHSLPTKYP